MGSGWGVASGRDFLKPDRFTTVSWAQDGTAVSYKCPCQSPGTRGPAASGGARAHGTTPPGPPSPRTSGLSPCLSLRCKAKGPITAPPAHPRLSSYCKSSEGRHHRGPPPGTKPWARHAASHPGGSCSNSATWSPWLHRPLRLPTGAHTRWAAGRRERTGHSPTAQGQGPLHIWGLLQETFPEAPFSSTALLRLPEPGLQAASGVLRDGLSTGREAESLQLRDPGLPPAGAESEQASASPEITIMVTEISRSRWAGPEAYTVPEALFRNIHKITTKYLE